jgi:hypothetical protein
MKNLRHILSLIVILMTASQWACDDNARAMNDIPVVTRGGAEASLDNMMRDDMMMGEMPEEPVKGARELIIDGAATRTLFMEDQLDLSVRYIGQEIGGEALPLANQPITMRLLDSTGADRTNGGIQGSRLQSSRLNTNAQGVASFRLFAGATETTFSLEANAADADPVFVTVSVIRPAAGGLSVRVLYSPLMGRYTYDQFQSSQVSLFTDRSCTQIIADADRLSGAEFSWPLLSPFNDINNTVSQGDFEDGAEFTIAASVYSVGGSAIAFGCIDDVRIEGGVTSEIDIDALDLPLQFKGKFVTTNRFDLTDLLESSEDETLNTVADILELGQILGSSDQDRGRDLIVWICDLVEIDETICDVGGTLLNDLIINALDDLIPPEVYEVLVIISDVITIVSEMTIVGEMEFTENYPDQENILINTKHSWNRFRFLWRDNCQLLEPDCYREFTLGTITQPGTAIRSTFDGEVDGNTLIIHEHGMNFRYGLIALGVAENWLIPAIVGQNMPVSFRVLLSDLMVDACMQIDMTVNNPGFCDSVIVNALYGVILDQLGRLDFDPEQFRLYGEADLLDENLDLRIDRLGGGKWYITIDTGSTVLHANGCFTACRDLECEAPFNECEIPDWTPVMEEEEMMVEEDMGGAEEPMGGSDEIDTNMMGMN